MSTTWSARRSSAARRSRRSPGIVEPGRGADEHEALDHLGTGQRGVEREPPAHRVAEVAAGAADLGHGRAAGGQVELDPGRGAVTGRVDEHQVVIGHEVGVDRRPAGRGLGESVDGDDPTSGPGRRGRREALGGQQRSRSGSTSSSCPAKPRLWLVPGSEPAETTAATFCATLVDEWVRAGVRHAVVLSRFALDAAGAGAGGRPGAAGARAPRRAIGGVRGPGDRVGDRSSRGGPHDQRHGRRRAAPRGGRGPSGQGGDAGLHGRSSSRAPRGRRAPDHRPATALRPGGAAVRRRRSRRWGGGGILALVGRPGGRGHHGRSARSGAPEPAVPGSVGRRSGGPPEGPRERASVACAGGRRAPRSTPRRSRRWPRRSGLVGVSSSPAPASRTGPRCCALARLLGWPVLADPRSDCRVPESSTISHFDAILRVPAMAARLAPEMVLRLGSLPASKVLSQWLAGLDAWQVAVETDGTRFDPDRHLDGIVAASAGRDVPADGGPHRSAADRATTIVRGQSGSKLGCAPTRWRPRRS